MAASNRKSWDETFAHRAGAALFTALVMLLMLRVLLHAPVVPMHEREQAMQVTFLARTPPQAPPPRVVVPPAVPPAPAKGQKAAPKKPTGT